MRFYFLSVFIILIFFNSTNAINYGIDWSLEKRNDALHVYIDCDNCDFSYFRMHINYINYTRDRQTADVHIKITDHGTGGGGRKYILNFFGQGKFAALDQKLEYISSQGDSNDDTRKGLSKIIEMGLMPYVSQTFQVSSIKIKYEQPENEAILLNDDPWNSWTYYIDFMGDLEVEQSQSELSLTAGIRADHTTEDFKVRSRVKLDYEDEQIEDDDETVRSILREFEADFRVVKSLNEKWSTGFNAGANATTFRNIEKSFSIAPAIEYNFYPWSQSDQKIIALAYFIGGRYYDYIEPTIFNKTSESLFFQGLSLQFEIIEPWGEIETNLNGSHFLHDFKKNQLEFFTSLSVHLLKGFSVKMQINVERLRDQLYLPQEGATRDEILLKRKKLATDYELQWSFGIEYAFGSIYNNVVNRRL